MLRVLAVGAIVCAGATLPTFASAQDGARVLVDNFESGRGMLIRNLAHNPHLALVEGEGVGGGRALRATYVGSARGSERIVRTLPLGSPGLEHTLNYDVRFPSGFQFVRGGKLHGLAPSDPLSGGAARRPDAWSVRVLWGANGTIETYTYHQGQRGRYGEREAIARPFTFQTGRYYAVSLHVRLNDPASESNGFVRLYVDGEMVQAREGLRFRSTERQAGLISRFMFSTFHGGHDPSWAPRNPSGGYADVYADFDNFAVYEGERIRPRPGS
jgi:hypothetical protein